MERTVSNTNIDKENVSNEKSTNTGMINSYIEEYANLEKSVEDSNKKIQCWVNQTSKLVESNCHIEASYNKLLQKVSDIDIKISESTRIYAIKKQELEKFQNTRANIFHMQWNNCFSEIESYASDISHWITEYSGQSLVKDIEYYRKECKPITEEIISLKQGLNDKEKGHNSDCIKANMDISTLNTTLANIKKSNDNLMYAIRSMEDTLHKVQKKIKQNKIIINEYKTKAKINVF